MARVPRDDRRALRLAAVAGMAALLLAPAAARAAGPWGAPVPLSGYGIDATAPQVAMNDGGAAVIAWAAGNGSRSRLQVATRPAGGVIGSPGTLSRADATAYGSDVAIAASGAAIVVWGSERGSRSRVMAAWRPAGATGFLTPVALSAPAERDVFPRVALNDAGEAIVTWGQFNGSKFVVQAAFGRPGAAFTAPVGISGPLKELAAAVKYVDPKASIDAAGNAIVVWENSKGVRGFVEGALRPAAGRFGAPTRLSAGNASFDPDLAMNARGEAVVAWYSLAADGWSARVRGAIRPPGGAFGPAADLSGPESAIYGPTVAIGDSGDALVAWTPGDFDEALVDAAVRAPGGPFVAMPGISPRAQNAFYPTVAVGSSGDMAATWSTGEAHDGVAGAVRPAGGAFAAGDVATNRTRFSGLFHDVDIDASGRAIAVWEARGAQGSILAAGSGDLGRVLHAGLPRLTRFGLTRSRLRAARSGPSFGASATPRTIVRFTLDAPAGVLLSIERATLGRRSVLGTCEAPTRRNRRDRPCTRYVPAGRQTLALPAGPNRVRFSGRARGRPLRPGGYRLVAVPSIAGRRGDAKRVLLRVVR